MPRQVIILNSDIIQFAQIFFYRALVVEGNLEEIPFDYDFAWLSAEEMSKVLPTAYYDAVKNIL